MLAALAINAVFSARGRAATYTPPGGGSSTPCTVIDDSRDRQAVGGLGRPVMRGNVLQVRISEIAAPAKGGTFTIDSETFKIVGDPITEDSGRLIWSCTVT
jgi:hypothetical protein